MADIDIRIEVNRDSDGWEDSPWIVGFMVVLILFAVFVELVCK